MIHHAREFTTTGDVLLQTGTNALVTFNGPPPFTFRIMSTRIAPMETTPLPLPASTSLIHIEYDPCDSMIYGILNHPPISIGLARYDRVANSFQTIATLDPLMSFCNCGDYIDPLTGVYALL